MHLRNGNGPASDGKRMCVAWLNELTSTEGVNLLSKVANGCTWPESSGAHYKARLARGSQKRATRKGQRDRLPQRDATRQ